ncbi:MAG: aromatic amino acid ammonia-lyase [Dermatophilaceae bacterium]
MQPTEIVLDGCSLSLETIEAIASRAQVGLAPAALVEVAHAAAAMVLAAERGPVYGRTTGVGANADQSIREVPDASGRALLRSHAAGWGPVLSPREVRAALGVRANQLLAGRSGASPDLARALAELASGEAGRLPIVRARGSLGTGDLTALAEVGLALAGERPRLDGTTVADPRLLDRDALPLMSGNAFTVASAALGCRDLLRLSRAAMVVAALSHAALAGSLEALGPVVEVVTPFPGAVKVARVVRGLVEPLAVPPSHLQDFFGLRTFPQVHGPLIERLDDLRRVIETLANTGSENPAVVRAEPPVMAHHGGFHTAYLTLAIDTALLALVGSAQSGASRIAHLLTDPTRGLPRFLAAGPPGSSGLLIVEYGAASALALLREAASAPWSLQTASVSAGIEDHASYAGAAAARLPDVVAAYRHLLGLELLTAVRAAQVRQLRAAGPLGEVLQDCSVLLQASPDGLAGPGDQADQADQGDRDLAPVIDAAVALVDGLTAHVSD